MSFASFYGCFVVEIPILPFFILVYSSPVLKHNPVLNLTPPIAIVSNKLTWSLTNCCVCLSIVCEEHARWQDLCRSWLQRHHQSLAMRICLPFAPGTSEKVFFPRELAPLLLVCDSRVCGWLLQFCLAVGVVELCCMSMSTARQRVN